MNEQDKTDLHGLSFIRNKVVHAGITPSLREVARELGYSSPRSVQLMLLRLQKAGFLRYTGGVITLSARKGPAAEHTIKVPLVGSVACGMPSLAEQRAEAVLEVSTKIAHPGNSYFLLRAIGNSMNKSGIKDKDLVLVRQQQVAAEGDKIVALINDGATIKHFHREGEMVVLRPNSTEKQYQPIILTDEFIIQGVVVATLPANIY